jgi:ABC-type proline/glycine betaine transport system substrate-binding protein
MKVRAGGLAVLAAIAVVALTAGGAGAKQAACGTVTLNQQAWAGSEANTYVA